MASRIDLKSLSVQELRDIIEEASTLINKKAEAERSKLIEEFRERAATLGTTPEELLGVRGKRRAKSGPGAASGKLYRSPDDPTLIYKGKGPRPKWLKEALDSGANLNDFLVAKG